MGVPSLGGFDFYQEPALSQIEEFLKENGFVKEEHYHYWYKDNLPKIEILANEGNITITEHPVEWDLETRSDIHVQAKNPSDLYKKVKAILCVFNE